MAGWMKPILLIAGVGIGAYVLFQILTGKGAMLGASIKGFMAGAAAVPPVITAGIAAPAKGLEQWVTLTERIVGDIGRLWQTTYKEPYPYGGPSYGGKTPMIYALHGAYIRR